MKRLSALALIPLLTLALTGCDVLDFNSDKVHFTN